MIAQLDDMVVTKNVYWGLDLTGTLTGAGGVGGLLMVQEDEESYLPAYDALGNVHAMIKASDGSLAASYEYDAYGRTLRESGDYAEANPFRYSTKYTDIETGLIYHDTRHYSPTLGRFLTRDTIGEQGGINLYAYVRNGVPNAWDYLGMNDAWNQYNASRFEHFDYDYDRNWGKDLQITGTLIGVGVVGTAAAAGTAVVVPKVATGASLVWAASTKAVTTASITAGAHLYVYGTKHAAMLTGLSYVTGVYDYFSKSSVGIPDEAFINNQLGPAFVLGQYTGFSVDHAIRSLSGIRDALNNGAGFADLIFPGVPRHTAGASPSNNEANMMDPYEVKEKPISGLESILNDHRPFVSARDRFDNLAFGGVTSEHMFAVENPMAAVWQGMVAAGHMTASEAQSREEAMRLKSNHSDIQ